MLDVRAAVLRGSRRRRAGICPQTGSRRRSSRSDILRTPASLIGDARSQRSRAIRIAGHDPRAGRRCRWCRLALGLSEVLAPEELIVAVNTGDDFEHLGLHISPDLDTVMYTLAGINDPIQGWGIAGETWNFMRRAGRARWTDVVSPRRPRPGDAHRTHDPVACGTELVCGDAKTVCSAPG